MDNHGQEKRKFDLSSLNNDELWNICEFLENKDLANFLITCKHVHKCIIIKKSLSDQQTLDYINSLKENNCIESLSQVFYIPGKSYMMAVKKQYSWRRQGLLDLIYCGEIEGVRYLLNAPGGEQNLLNFETEEVVGRGIYGGMAMFLFVKQFFTVEKIAKMKSVFVQGLVSNLQLQRKGYEVGKMLKILLDEGFKIDRAVLEWTLPMALHTEQFGIASVLMDPFLNR